MKEIFLLLATLFTICLAFSQKNHWVKDNLKDSVFSYSEISYKIETRSGKIQKIYREREYSYENDFKKRYNKKGYTVEKILYNSKGDLEKRYTFKYNKIGLETEKNFYNSNDLIEKRIIQKYDENGNVLEWKEYNSKDSLESLFIYKYEKLNDTIKRRLYNQDNELLDKLTFNGPGIIEKINYNSNYPEYAEYKISDRTSYKYDGNGNLVEQNYFVSDERLISRNTYEYDNESKLILRKIYNTEGILEKKFTYKYDDKENLIEEKEYISENEDLFRIKTYKYDDKGNLLEEKKYNSEEKLYQNFVYKYEFDSHGNWTKRFKFISQIPKYVSERVYEYYK